MSLSCLTGPILDIVRTPAGTGDVRELQNVTVLLGGSSSRQCQGFILNCHCYRSTRCQCFSRRVHSLTLSQLSLEVVMLHSSTRCHCL